MEAMLLFTLFYMYYLVKMNQLFLLFIQYILSYYLGYFISAICVYTKAYNKEDYEYRNNYKPRYPIN